MSYDTDINDYRLEVDQDSCYTSSTTFSSRYREGLNRWAIAHLVRDQKPKIVGRFRSRSDADGYLQCLHQKFPEDNFIVIFDQQQNQAGS
jgi:hypothetical protein